MAEEQKKKAVFRFSRKEFWIDGVIWTLFLVFVLTVWKAGAAAVWEIGRLRALIERNESERFEREPFDPFGNRKKEPALESWIRRNLPGSAEERETAARIFAETASMLREGKLKGVRDSFAELTGRLQPELDRRVWYPFLAELTRRAAKEIPNGAGAEETAELLDRIAAAFGGVGFGFAEVPLSPSPSRPEPEKANPPAPPKPAPQAVSAAPGTCVSGNCVSGTCVSSACGVR